MKTNFARWIPATTNRTKSVVLGLAALAVVGGIAGGAVALAVPAAIQARAADQAAQAERDKWISYGEEWERRYRQMYPIIEQS